MPEKSLKNDQNNLDIIFRDELGVLVKIDVNSKVSIEKLIQEREGLGETVLTIACVQEAETLMNNFEAFSRMHELNDQIFSKR